MKKIPYPWKKSFGRALPAFILSLGLLVGSVVSSQAATKKPPVRVLLITGGHGYRTNLFLRMFQSLRGIQVRHVEHPNNVYEWWTPEKRDSWDVLVFYDLWQKIPDEAKTNLIDCLHSGKGLVILHHAMANYQDWPEYERIMGGRYFLRPTKRDGKVYPRSSWKHGVDIQVHVVNPRHPITRGMKDFTIHDEIYGLVLIHPDVQPLLTTKTPGSLPILAWISPYKPARVVVIQSGHDEHAWNNPNFRKVLRRSILWVARRLGDQRRSRN